MELITIIFLTIAITLTASIYLKSQKISKLSSHKGISSISKAFLFLTITYTLQLSTKLLTLSISSKSILITLLEPIQIYLFTISALYLTTSMFWKNSQKDSTILHAIAILTAIISNFTETLALALTVIYALASVKAHENYCLKKTIFSQAHLIAFSLLTLANLTLFLEISPISNQAMTIAAFAIFLYGTLKSAKK